MSVYSPPLDQDFFGQNNKATLLWIECGSCNGESMAILGAEGPGKTGDNLPDFLEDEQVRLLWHPSLSEAGPKEASATFDRILASARWPTSSRGSMRMKPTGEAPWDSSRG